MITQIYLNNEISLASRIFLFYIEKMLDYSSFINYIYQQWYIDSMELAFLIDVLDSIELVGSDIYLGADTVESTILIDVFYKVREYWLEEIDDEYQATSLGDIVVPTGSTYQPYIIDWKEVTITITSDTTTTVSLPFDMALVDPESVIITVEDEDPIPTTADKDGYHITGNTLYWHNYYDLNTGDRMHIKYLQIKGLI